MRPTGRVWSKGPRDNSLEILSLASWVGVATGRVMKTDVNRFSKLFHSRAVRTEELQWVLGVQGLQFPTLRSLNTVCEGGKQNPGSLRANGPPQKQN